MLSALWHIYERVECRSPNAQRALHAEAFRLFVKFVAYCSFLDELDLKLIVRATIGRGIGTTADRDRRPRLLHRMVREHRGVGNKCSLIL
jgi:hypothetical protein